MAKDPAREIKNIAAAIGEIKEAVRLGIDKSARPVQIKIRNKAFEKDLYWRGELTSGVEIVKRGNGFQVSIPEHGFYLDKMEPHTESLARGTLMREWYLDKIDVDESRVPSSIGVNPHKWLDEATDEGIENIVVNNIVNEIERRFK